MPIAAPDLRDHRPDGALARLVALAALALTGCGSVTSYQSAETLPCGSWQAHAALGAGSFKDDPQQTRTPTANLELGVRYGLAPATDVGLKLYTLGIEASVRQRLRDGGAHGWSLAALGAVGGVRTTARGALSDMILVQARTGGVATRRTSRRWAWNLGLTSTASLFVPAGGGHATGVLLGGLVGFDWRVASRWHLVPELSLHRSVIGEVPVDGTVAQLGAALALDF